MSCITQQLLAADHLLNAGELARLLQLAVPTIYKHAKNGTLPTVRVGYALRFDGSAVVKALGLK